MKKITLLLFIFTLFVSCQQKVDENVKTSHSFKDGKLSVTCEKSPKSGICNYLIYKMNCDKTEPNENKEKLTCLFTEITQFKLKEKESKTIPNLSKNPKICMIPDVVPTLENCVKE